MERITLFNATIMTLGVSASFILLTYLHKKRNVKKWHYVGDLSQIIIYPLKAGSGIHLKEAYCSEEGLIEHNDTRKFILGDRYFIAYEENTGMRISSKDFPIISRVKVIAIDDVSAAISAPGYDTFQFVVPIHSDKKANCMIFPDIPSETIDCGDEVAQWMSNVIFKSSKGVRLGFYIRNKINKRSDTAGMLKSYKILYPEVKPHHLGAYSFLASYLLINQASLDDLNNQLAPGDGPVTSIHFRSNLTISGQKAYAEDDWKLMKIGENVILKNIKPCTRCMITTLNPETEQFNANYEPLRTLRKYRLPKDPEVNKIEGWSPVFGQYFGLNKAGIIKLGDPVYTTED